MKTVDRRTQGIDIQGFRSISDAAEAVGGLRHDALEAFLGALAARLSAEAASDRANGHQQIADSLDGVSAALEVARDKAADAWAAGRRQSRLW